MNFSSVGLSLGAAGRHVGEWFRSINSRSPASLLVEEPPLRAGLFSVQQLAQHATVLAEMHVVSSQRGADRLIPRLHENEQVLLRTYDLLAGAVLKGYQITPATEWLLDNFYVMEEQILIARKHFPRSYGQSLPQLKAGPSAGMPRVYAMALDIVSHVDGGVDSVNLGAFIASYQQVSPLTLGELWAIPIMLRLALIENLRRICAESSATGHGTALAGANTPPDPTDLSTRDRGRQHPKCGGQRGGADARRPGAECGRTRGTFAVQWTPAPDGVQCGRRLQPLG